MGTFKDSLSRTRQAFLGRLATALGASEITADTWDDLEATLIGADLGVATASAIVNRLRERARAEGITRGERLRMALRDELRSRLAEAPPAPLDGNPAVLLVVGVNGSGKTTTAAKLGWWHAAHGRKVLFAAADTFRAAAIEQMQVWGRRLGRDVIAGQPGGDPGAVVFDAVNAARRRGCDLVIADTAGRLHTKFNLMQELKKVRGVAAKASPGAPHEVLLVLDATTGQNALAQARHFKEAVGVTGVVLAKLDGSARGGMAFAVGGELGLPLRFVGTGEAVEDLEEFDAVRFVDGLLESGS